MKNIAEWNVPKWPFVAGWLLLLGAAGYGAAVARHPLGAAEVAVVCGCVALGALLGVLPYILEYRATARLIEVNGLAAVAEKIQNLDRVASQITACTNDWTTAQTQAEKTAGLSREIATRMGEEVRQFSEFMQRMSDSEKAALRLEIEKLHRAEGEWLQVLVRILDHVFALHTAAVHSGQPQLTVQIGQFQAACLDAARRVGLGSLAAEPGEPFHPERHQPVGLKETPPAAAVVAETMGLGYKFQGKLLRPVLVRLRHPAGPAGESPVGAAPGEPDPKAGEGRVEELKLSEAEVEEPQVEAVFPVETNGHATTTTVDPESKATEARPVEPAVAAQPVVATAAPVEAVEAPAPTPAEPDSKVAEVRAEEPPVPAPMAAEPVIEVAAPVVVAEVTPPEPAEPEAKATAARAVEPPVAAPVVEVAAPVDVAAVTTPLPAEPAAKAAAARAVETSVAEPMATVAVVEITAPASPVAPTATPPAEPETEPSESITAEPVVAASAAAEPEPSQLSLSPQFPTSATAGKAPGKPGSRRKIRAAAAKEVGVGNPAEETTATPNQNPNV